MTLLHRINPALNQARYYYIEVGPCITSLHAVHRTWGRLGHRRSGALIRPCADRAEAEALAARLLARKVKRGYVIVEPQEEL